MSRWSSARPAPPEWVSSMHALLTEVCRWCGQSRVAHYRHRTPSSTKSTARTSSNRWLLAPLLRVTPALGISAVDLGRAMLCVGLDESWHGSRTLENSDLKALLHEGNHFGG